MTSRIFPGVRRLVSGGAMLLILIGGPAAGEQRLVSPDGRVAVTLSVDGTGQLSYEASFHGQTVLARAPLGLTLDGHDLGKVSALKALRVREDHQRYPVRGVHAEAHMDASRALYAVTSKAGPVYGVEVAAADGGVAWRIVVPGKGIRRVTAETACWRLPGDSRAWFAERLSDWKLKTYAGEWICAPLNTLGTVSPQGPVQTMPLVAELPQGAGYAVVTEAALFRYSGLRLRAERDGTLRGDFTEPDGFEVEGEVRTPWRAVLLASTLDALVNDDLITSLSPPPDPALFGDTAWIRCGRSVWSWWQNRPDYLSIPAEKKMIDDAAALTFEFTMLDEGWEAWPDTWTALKTLCDYGRARKVGVFVWKNSKELNRPADDFAALRGFLDQVQKAGAAGVKVDFMDSESASTIRFDERVLREAARRKLLVDFHGCQKPSGESRTYPNELTREGVRGLELNRIAETAAKRRSAAGGSGEKEAARNVPGGENQPIPASHNAALPFTRCLAGPADYTPLGFSRPGETTWAHQLATAYLVTSPLMVMADHPRHLLETPALADTLLPFIRDLPVTWDETCVLEGSRIGELAAFARRSGETWYVAMVNGTHGLKIVSVSLSFTGWEHVRLVQVSDEAGAPARVAVQSRDVRGSEPLLVMLQPCGGYVAKLERDEPGAVHR